MQIRINEMYFKEIGFEENQNVLIMQMLRLVNIPKKESLIKIQYTYHGVSVSGDFVSTIFI